MIVTKKLTDRHVAQRDGPNPIDLHVGQRLRQRRLSLDLTQEELGARIDVSFQQIQKYERGTNRISVARLLRLAEALDVDISYFFADLSRDPQDFPHLAFDPARQMAEDAAPPIEPADVDPALREEAAAFVRWFHRIADPLMRKRIADLAREMARLDANLRKGQEVGEL